MPHYTYTALDKGELEVKDCIEAANEQEALQRISSLHPRYTNIRIVVFNKTTPRDAENDKKKFRTQYQQHHFTRGEIRNIEVNQKDSLIQPTRAWLEKKLAARQGKKTLKSDQMEKAIDEAYNTINDRMKAADLTINFDAWKWFRNPNTYGSYSQVFERSVDKTSGKVKLSEDTVERNQWDNRYTENFGGNRTMDTGKLIKHGDRLQRHHNERVNRENNGGMTQNCIYYTPSNPDFDPSSRQVFAALNYGRRFLGSIPYWGCSYLVLNDNFKTNALYYPCDTIHDLVIRQHSVSHNLLVTVLGMDITAKHMKNQIFESCFDGMTLSDLGGNGGDGSYCLEAHIYGGITFSADTIKEVHIHWQTTGTNCPTYETGEMNHPDNRQIIMRNVYDWCDRFHLDRKIVQIHTSTS